MRPLALTAAGIVTALGDGRAATLAALRDRRDGLRACDFETLTLGFIGRVSAVERHALPPALSPFDCRNNRLADLALRSDGFAEAAAAAHAIHPLVHPGEALHFEYSTTKGVPA